MEVDVAGQEIHGLEHIMTEWQDEISKQEAALCSATMLAEARHPRNLEAMPEPDGHAALHGACGDKIEISIRVAEQRIQQATFTTTGCKPTVACGSMLTTMAQGKTLDEAAAIRAVDMDTALGGLPPEHVHCASLAVNTLRLAILTYQGPGERANVEFEAG